MNIFPEYANQADQRLDPRALLGVRVSSSPGMRHNEHGSSESRSIFINSCLPICRSTRAAFSFFAVSFVARNQIVHHAVCTVHKSPWEMIYTKMDPNSVSGGDLSNR